MSVCRYMVSWCVGCVVADVILWVLVGVVDLCGAALINWVCMGGTSHSDPITHAHSSHLAHFVLLSWFVLGWCFVLRSVVLNCTELK